MRYLIVLVLLTLPVTADAQGRGRNHRAQQRPHGSEQTPRAAALARKVPPSVLLPAGSRRPDIFDRSRSAWPRWQEPRGHAKGRFHGNRSPFFGGVYYATPYFGYGPGYGYEAAPYEPEPEPAAMVTTGTLRLDITPTVQMQYYADGMFIGSSAELGTEFAVNAGARRIEIRAAGYRPVMFDARFVPGGTVTRRGALEPLENAAALPRATGSRTMYVIPGCFMGNARPEAASLPKGCDINRLVTRGGL
jgi:hypothetical protein